MSSGFFRVIYCFLLIASSRYSSNSRDNLRFVESMRRLAVAMVPYEREREMENDLSVFMAR